MSWDYWWQLQTEFQLNMQFECAYLQAKFKPREGNELCNCTVNRCHEISCGVWNPKQKKKNGQESKSSLKLNINYYTMGVFSCPLEMLFL
jgi:hypothetical protein